MTQVNWSKPIEAVSFDMDDEPYDIGPLPARVLGPLKRVEKDSPYAIAIEHHGNERVDEASPCGRVRGQEEDLIYFMVRNRALRLYVWPNFCPDYDPGIAFAIAADLESAKELVKASYAHEPGKSPGFSWGRVEEYPIEPIAFGRRGGS